MLRWDREQTSYKQIYRVDGYAGTGKSSAIMHTVDKMSGSTVFAAYTGKAASVLQSKGCANAQTIHSLIYKPSGSGKDRKQEADDLVLEIDQKLDDYIQGEKMTPEEAEEQEAVQQLRSKLAHVTSIASSPMFRRNVDSAIRDVDRVVIDESSMISDDIAHDLLSFDVPVLVMGDPGQLPPVYGQGFFSRGEPDFQLTEIHRQAEGSPIIQMSVKARKGERLALGMYGSSGVFNHVPEWAPLQADQIIVGRNSTRRMTNDRMRELLGFVSSAATARQTLPKQGEKVICLRNNNKLGLLNGTLWTVVDCHSASTDRVSLTIVPEEGGLPITVLAHDQYFTSPHNDPKRINQEIGFSITEAESFDYGYCITAHKAQGSQWGKVLIIDQSGSFPQPEKWLYTAITRAIHDVWVVRK